MKPEDYKAIAAWCTVVNSSSDYLAQMQSKAAKENAPPDAIYYHERWHTVREVTKQETLAWLRMLGIPTPHADEWDKVTDPRSPEEWISFLCGTRCRQVYLVFWATYEDTEAHPIDRETALSLVHEYGDELDIQLGDGRDSVYIGGSPDIW